MVFLAFDPLSALIGFILGMLAFYSAYFSNQLMKYQFKEREDEMVKRVMELMKRKGGTNERIKKKGN